MDELLGASTLLKSALTTYMTVCSDVTRSYNPFGGNRSESRAFLDCITRELQTMANFEVDIRVAKSTLARCRNSCPTIAPVHTLPPEVLVQIFTLLRDDPGHCSTRNDNGMFEQGDPDATHPNSPLILSHVCSRWRRIAAGARGLWSHINITTTSQKCAKLLPQAELFRERADLVPLNLHILNPRRESVIECSKSISRQVSNACALIAPNTRSFRLDNLEQGGNGFSYLLYHFLRYAEPMALRELRLLDHGGSGSAGLLEPKDFSHQGDQGTWHRSEQLWLSTRAVNKRLLSVEVLWLRNVFFPWSSHAYIGLTDLRLIADRGGSGFTAGGPHIRISELVRILSSSPRLRALHCNLWVDVRDAQQALPHVPLKQLEVLDLHRMASGQSSQLLAYIYPGDKPLELSLFVPDEREQSPDPFLPGLVLDFFRRSRVTKLFLHKDGGPEKYDNQLIKVSLAKLLSELPAGLRTLGLNRFQVYEGTGVPLYWPTQLSTVYMRSWDVDVMALQTLASICPLRELMLSHSPVRSRDKELLKEEVATMVPILSTSWNPPERWRE